MKRVVMLLIGTMALSLASCGSSSTNSKSTSDSKTDTVVETTANVSQTTVKEEKTIDEVVSNIPVHMNEKVKIGDYEIMITDVQFVSNWNPDRDHYGYCDDGYVKLLVFWNVKNIGKSESRTPDHCLGISYGDGYSFYADNTYHFSKSTKSWVVNANELRVLSDAVECQTCFNVPNQVQGNTSETLKVIIDASKMNAEGTYEYTVRPADDEQKVAVEKQAEKWLSTGKETDSVRAIDSLITTGCNKEAIDKAFTASKDDIYKYIKDGSINYLDGDKIAIILSQAWNYYDGTNVWNSYEAEQNIKAGMSYKVDGDKLIINTPEGKYPCKVGINSTGSYVLVCKNKEFAILYNSIMYLMITGKN